MRDASWRVLNLESVEPSAAAYLETTIQLIQDADAVIAVLGDHDTGNALFEAGIALGMGRQLLLIAEDEAVLDNGLADRVLATLPRVRARIADNDAVRFHVTAFLDGVARKSEPGVTDAPPSKGPLNRVKGRSSRSSLPASRLEARLLSAFESAVEVEAVQLGPQLGGRRQFRPDFALWLSETRHVLPNPLIVELANYETGLRNQGNRLAQLQSYANESGVGAVMLVEAGRDQPLHLLQLRPMIFRVGLGQIQALLSEQRLLPEMVRARNLLAHSAG